MNPLSLYQQLLDWLWVYYMRLPESRWEAFVYRVWKLLS